MAQWRLRTVNSQELMTINPDPSPLQLVLPRGHIPPAPPYSGAEAAKFYSVSPVGNFLDLRLCSLCDNYWVLPSNWKQPQTRPKWMGVGYVPVKLYLQNQVASPRSKVCWLLLWSKAKRINHNKACAAKAVMYPGLCLLCPLALDVHTDRLDKEDRVSRWTVDHSQDPDCLSLSRATTLIPLLGPHMTSLPMFGHSVTRQYQVSH